MLGTMRRAATVFNECPPYYFPANLTSMLHSLAPELIQAISHELKSIDDIKSFRLTCKQTDQALATEVLHRITVDINKENFERELCKLQYLAEGSSSCRSIHGIKQLDIKSLTIVLYPSRPRTDTETAYDEELKQCLYNALSSLTGVRTVRWSLNWRESAWTHTVVVDALKMFPNLQSLHITYLPSLVEIPFHSFTALRHISVCCASEDHPDSYHEKTFENLVKMISQSPLLESIAVGFFAEHGTIFEKSLYQLFECYSENIPPLRLKHLSLANCFVRLDDEKVMRHLRYLTSLSINDLLEPYCDSDDLGDDDPQKWGSSYEQIWKAIAATELRLEEITTDTAPLAFAEYIGTYSGLKKLKLVAWDFDDKTASDSAAKKFYEGLEKHAGSIEELDVDAYYEGLWCFGHHNQALFSTFQNLTTLGVRIQPDDIVLSSEGDPSSQDIIKVLIDTVVTHMPHLQVLCASAATLERYRNSRCGNSSKSHLVRYKEKVTARVLEYKAPWGCQRLPMFKLGRPSPERTFVGQSSDLVKEGERLRYLFDSDT